MRRAGVMPTCNALLQAIAGRHFDALIAQPGTVSWPVCIVSLRKFPIFAGMADETRVPEETSEDLMRRDDFESRHPRDIAEGMRDIPVAKIEDVLRALPKARAAQVLSELPRKFRCAYLNRYPSAISAISSAEMFSDDAADVLGHIPAAKLREIMRGMSAPEAKQINDLLQYPEDTAGGHHADGSHRRLRGSHDRGGHRNASTGGGRFTQWHFLYLCGRCRLPTAWRSSRA